MIHDFELLERFADLFSGMGYLFGDDYWEDDFS